MAERTFNILLSNIISNTPAIQINDSCSFSVDYDTLLITRTYTYTLSDKISADDIAVVVEWASDDSSAEDDDTFKIDKLATDYVTASVDTTTNTLTVKEVTTEKFNSQINVKLYSISDTTKYDEVKRDYNGGSIVITNDSTGTLFDQDYCSELYKIYYAKYEKLKAEYPDYYVPNWISSWNKYLAVSSEIGNIADETTKEVVQTFGGYWIQLLVMMIGFHSWIGDSTFHLWENDSVFEYSDVDSGYDIYKNIYCNYNESSQIDLTTNTILATDQKVTMPQAKNYFATIFKALLAADTLSDLETVCTNYHLYELDDYSTFAYTYEDNFYIVKYDQDLKPLFNMCAEKLLNVLNNIDILTTIYSDMSNLSTKIESGELTEEEAEAILLEEIEAAGLNVDDILVSEDTLLTLAMSIYVSQTIDPYYKSYIFKISLRDFLDAYGYTRWEFTKSGSVFIYV